MFVLAFKTKFWINLELFLSNLSISQERENCHSLLWNRNNLLKSKLLCMIVFIFTTSCSFRRSFSTVYMKLGISSCVLEVPCRHLDEATPQKRVNNFLHGSKKQKLRKIGLELEKNIFLLCWGSEEHISRATASTCEWKFCGFYYPVFPKLQRTPKTECSSSKQQSWNTFTPSTFGDMDFVLFHFLLPCVLQEAGVMF